MKRRGFTLVEAIAAMTVLAALGTGVSMILLAATDGYISANTTAQLHLEASVAMDRIVRELRKVDLDGGGNPDIDTVGTSDITWEADNTLELVGTDLEYTHNGGTPAVLLSDVTRFTISVADESDTTLSLPRSGTGCDAIRRITVTVTVERHGVSEPLRGEVYLRSVMAGAGS